MRLDSLSRGDKRAEPDPVPPFVHKWKAGRERAGFVTQRGTEDGLDQGKGLDHGDTVSTLGTYFIISINQLQRVSSAVDLPAE